jgi:hypothetical protein
MPLDQSADLLADPAETLAYPGLFAADEVGWIAAEAAIVAARTGVASFGDAHRLVVGIANLAAHPRLRANLTGSDLGLAQATYLQRWDGAKVLPTQAGARHIVLFLGWRGGLELAGNVRIASEPGLAVRLDAALLSSAKPIGETLGGVLVLAYSADGETLPQVADDALWPQVWCAAG